MRSGDVALRLLVVFSIAGFIAVVASLYEVNRRDKSSSDTVAANLTNIAQQVQVLTNEIHIQSNQFDARERQTQALGRHIQSLDLRLKELEDQLPRSR